jgi:hypothetical protein
VCELLGIKTKISYSWDYEIFGGKTERLANLCESVGAEEYISGPSARNYLDESVFVDRGLKITWFDYTGYPEYSQLWGEFTHTVSIIDLLFNCGKDASRYMKYVTS